MDRPLSTWLFASFCRSGHIWIKCPAGERACEPQEPLPPGDGCDKSLAWSFTNEARHPAPSKLGPPITMAQLPAECRTVVLEK